MTPTPTINLIPVRGLVARDGDVQVLLTLIVAMMIEAITGTLYMAVMVARLVALYYSPGSSVATPPTKP